ncbi:MAG: hypothetical protein H0X58_05085 [Acidimicrobiia bacterium]|jgi:hypothetical protein|nr:hypothetical protein [Acidimicrobiia bacterium]
MDEANPYAAPTGPAVDDATVLECFARDVAAGHSTRFNVERPTLLVDRNVAAAVRIAPRTVLVRADLPPDLTPAKGEVEAALATEGLTCLDEDTLLATPVALQLFGLRLSSWDLWGDDIDDGFAALRAGCIAEQRGPFEGPSPF